jgi:hypothetical protein
MDETCTLFLFCLFAVFMLKTDKWVMNKPFLLTLGVFLFYLFYSMYIQSNTKRGIFNDFFVQIKPYLGFFCVYSMKPRMSAARKSLLKSVAVLFWLILLCVGIGSLVSHRLIIYLFTHPSNFAAAVTITSLCYLYCSKFTFMEKLNFLLMLSLGVLSGRSKFYGFFALSVFVIVFFSRKRVFKLNFRNLLIFFGALAVMLLVAWQKIDFYFYQAVTGEVEKDVVARYILYATMPLVLYDYFPFGSGLASFATYSSGQFYSPLYSDYGIDGIWGISKNYYSFIADTYYPSLAQFGVAGIVLFLLFWGHIFRKAYGFYIRNDGEKDYLFYIIILIISYLAIDSVAAPTFISYCGFFVMMMLGLMLVEMKDRESLPNRKCSYTQIYGQKKQ